VIAKHNSFEYDEIKKVLKKSVLHAKHILRYYNSWAKTKVGVDDFKTPFIRSNNENTVIVMQLRNPRIMTGAHSSACDCETICSISGQTNYGEASGGKCLGTISNVGKFYPVCNVTGQYAPDRVQAWRETNFCGLSNDHTCKDSNMPLFSTTFKNWHDETPVQYNTTDNLSDKSFLDHVKSFVGYYTPFAFKGGRGADPNSFIPLDSRKFPSNTIKNGEFPPPNVKLRQRQNAIDDDPYIYSPHEKFCVCVQNPTRNGQISGQNSFVDSDGRGTPQSPFYAMDMRFTKYNCPYKIPDIEEQWMDAILNKEPLLSKILNDKNVVDYIGLKLVNS
jgi:hypothetical protein